MICVLYGVLERRSGARCAHDILLRERKGQTLARRANMLGTTRLLVLVLRQKGGREGDETLGMKVSSPRMCDSSCHDSEDKCTLP